MIDSVDTLVIGGGCLGCAVAVSTQRKLREQNDISKKVCVIDKSLIGSGLTSRHSGLVRAANAVPKAATLAKQSIDYWKNLKSIWGVNCEFESNGAVWIARDTNNGTNDRWSKLSESLKSSDISFSQIEKKQAKEVCGENIKFYDNEVYYYEEDAIQFDPGNIRDTLYAALQKNNIETIEKVSVDGFIKDKNGEINTVLTSKGNIECKNVVNAAGPWSPSIFKSLNISIPVSTESVRVVNWLTSQNEINKSMPIICDYANLAYFRTWRDGEIHMHQPRRRSIKETAKAFSENPLTISGAEFVNDPSNQSLGYSQIRIYQEIAAKRFHGMDKAIYGSGYKSYFDITPDLKFILGADHRVSNLYHCLGAGQAFKYAPVFGELVADCIVGNRDAKKEIEEFSINRFNDSYMEYFWSQVSGVDYTLETEAASL